MAIPIISQRRMIAKKNLLGVNKISFTRIFRSEFSLCLLFLLEHLSGLLLSAPQNRESLTIPTSFFKRKKKKSENKKKKMTRYKKNEKKREKRIAGHPGEMSKSFI